MGQVDYNNIIIISIYVAHVLNPVRIHEGGAVEDRFMNLQDKYQTTIRNVTSILFKRSFLRHIYWRAEKFLKLILQSVKIKNHL